MKKLLSITLAATLLFACGGDAESGEKGGAESAKGSAIELSSTKSPLDKFEKKSALGFKSGMSWSGGKVLQPMLYIAFSNMDKLTVGYANFDMPEKDGDVIIVIQVSGEKFDKGGEPTKIVAGEYPVGGDSFSADVNGAVSVYAQVNGDRVIGNLSMSRSTSANDFTGMIIISKVTDQIVEGTFDITGADGTSFKGEFSEKLGKDLWASEFKNGKL